MQVNLVVALTCGFILTFGPCFGRLSVRDGLDRDLFPNITTLLGSLLALLILPICHLPGALTTNKRFVRLTTITIAIFAFQAIVSWRAKLSQSLQVPSLHILSISCLLSLAFYALSTQAIRAFLDLLGLSLALVTISGLKLQGLPTDSQYDRHAAILDLISEFCLGLLCTLIIVQLPAISPRQQLSEFPKDESHDSAAWISDHPMNHTTRWSIKRTYIFLIFVQIGFSLILFFSTDMFRIESVRLSETTIRSVSKAALILWLILTIQYSDIFVTITSVLSLILMGHYFAEGMTIRDIGFGFFCLMSYSRLKMATVHIKKIYLACAVFLALGQWLQYRNDFFALHPLQLLMKDAQRISDAFEAHESTIVDLQTAVHDYHSRYQRLPPPGFDHWWNYSQQHDAVVKSNYDQIVRDLQPFWSLEPRILRERTYTAIRDRNNYLSPLRIRNGAVMAPPMLIPTHYWMLEGLMAMMTDFVQFLPDMDIAINLNDEPRVLAHPGTAASDAVVGKGGDFTLSSQHWLEEIPFKEERPESFTKVERQLRNTYDFSTQHCTTKQARSARSSSNSPISHFVPNWRDSLNICNDIHLKHSRGFFISPASYDVTDELMPVFSQSKPSTFNDILLPSPWNYNDKVGPDTEDHVPWSEKSDRVYWRGTTTEGWATWGSWRSMLRQRMVDLLRGAHSFALNPATTLTLQGSDSTGYHSEQRSVPDLAREFDPDVFFVEVVRSDEADANDQIEHFEMQPPNEFKEHWKHRYLLDTDGAAFSGRFLPFLQSKSLPLKFTSVFTEWWSDRIFAYQHFVPVTLGNVYDVLTYFVGIPTDDVSFGSEGHSHEAHTIASQGEAWAKAALRKADMKIYLFRLLLEYGRLVDDKRDEIGLALP